MKPDQEVLDARMVTERLQALGKRIDYFFQVTGEPGIEQVVEDINIVIDMFIEMERNLSRCRKKHGDSYEELVKKAETAKKLASAVHEIRTKCTVCRGPCTHFDLNSLPMRQLENAMYEARRTNVFDVPVVSNS